MTQEDRAYCYFHYKVGTGNRYLDLAISPNNGEAAMLYVGFSDVVEASDADDFDPLRHIALRPTEPVYVARSNPEFTTKKGQGKRLDENYIAWLRDDANREWVRLLVFSEDHLYVFRATSSELACATPEHRPALFKRAMNVFEKKRKESDETPKVFKFIQAERVGPPIERSKLYTAIDSLRTYQFLNQGTCRPVWRAKGPGADLWSGQFRELLNIPTSLRSTLSQELRKDIDEQSSRYDGAIDREEPFGNFIRRYLNQLVPGGDPADLRSLIESLPTALPTEEARHRFWQTMAFATMNPILTETAAFYFCLDLGLHKKSGHRGLIPDVGVGKGLDTIDLRARFLPGESEAETRSLVLDRLAPLVKLDDDWTLQKLLEKGVLEIQCKASSSKKSKPGPVYFGPDGGVEQGNRIHLQDVVAEVNANPKDWPLLNAFMKIQVLTIQGNGRA